MERDQGEKSANGKNALKASEKRKEGCRETRLLQKKLKQVENGQLTNAMD